MRRRDTFFFRFHSSSIDAFVLSPPMTSTYHEDTYVHFPSIRRQTRPYGSLLFFSSSSSNYHHLSFSFSIYIDSQLFLFALFSRFFFFFSFSLCLSLSLARAFVRYYLLGSVGLTTKNQPSRALDDKQVKERTSSVRHIISIHHPLEVSSVFVSLSLSRVLDQLQSNIPTELEFNSLPSFDICTVFLFHPHHGRKEIELCCCRHEKI